MMTPGDARRWKTLDQLRLSREVDQLTYERDNLRFHIQKVLNTPLMSRIDRQLRVRALTDRHNAIMRDLITASARLAHLRQDLADPR
jgi:hypothetical protein